MLLLQALTALLQLLSASGDMPVLAMVNAFLLSHVTPNGLRLQATIIRRCLLTG